MQSTGAGRGWRVFSPTCQTWYEGLLTMGGEGSVNYGQVSQGEEKGSPVQPQKQWVLFVLLMKGGRTKDIIFMQRNYFRHSVYNLQEIISHCIQKHKNQRGEQKGKGPQCDPSLGLGVLNLRGLMPHDLRWSWLITTLEIKCPVNVIPLNHPKSTPPTPALVHEKTVFHETHSWCQKSWGPLPGSTSKPSIKRLNLLVRGERKKQEFIKHRQSPEHQTNWNLRVKIRQ